MTRIAIVGSRDFPNLQRVRDYVNSLPDDTIIVSGGARGVDKVAEQTARIRGLQVIVFLPEWRVNGVYVRSAAFQRDVLIVNKCDKLVAFWDGKSKGTAHSINLAKKRRIPFTVYEVYSSH